MNYKVELYTHFSMELAFSNSKRMSTPTKAHTTSKRHNEDPRFLYLASLTFHITIRLQFFKQIEIEVRMIHKIKSQIQSIPPPLRIIANFLSTLVRIFYNNMMHTSILHNWYVTN
jgi:hypothetical protein